MFLLLLLLPQLSPLAVCEHIRGRPERDAGGAEGKGCMCFHFFNGGCIGGKQWKTHLFRSKVLVLWCRSLCYSQVNWWKPRVLFTIGGTAFDSGGEVHRLCRKVQRFNLLVFTSLAVSSHCSMQKNRGSEAG